MFSIILRSYTRMLTIEMLLVVTEAFCDGLVNGRSHPPSLSPNPPQHTSFNVFQKTEPITNNLDLTEACFIFVLLPTDTRQDTIDLTYESDFSYFQTDLQWKTNFNYHFPEMFPTSKNKMAQYEFYDEVDRFTINRVALPSILLEKTVPRCYMLYPLH